MDRELFLLDLLHPSAVRIRNTKEQTYLVGWRSTFRHGVRGSVSFSGCHGPFVSNDNGRLGASIHTHFIAHLVFSNAHSGSLQFCFGRG